MAASCGRVRLIKSTAGEWQSSRPMAARRRALFILLASVTVWAVVCEELTSTTPPLSAGAQVASIGHRRCQPSVRLSAPFTRMQRSAAHVDCLDEYREILTLSISRSQWAVKEFLINQNRIDEVTRPIKHGQANQKSNDSCSISGICVCVLILDGGISSASQY